MIRRVAALALGKLPVAALLAVVIAVGCVAAEPGVPVRVENRTDIPVGVYVDDAWIGTDEPGAVIEATLRPAAGRSHRIEARSPSGTVLAAFEATSAAIEAVRDGGPPLSETFGPPCGVISIVIGDPGPNESIAPAPSVASGPCP